jgi:MFS family permease
VIGPLIAFVGLQWIGLSLRELFWVAAVPGAVAVLVALFGVREQGREKALLTVAATAPSDVQAAGAVPLPRVFWKTLAPIGLFALGNSTDAFLLLRAHQLGVATALLPALWGVLHVVKSASSTPGGALSDRVGRVPLIVGGWITYALVYIGFGMATSVWQAWALFAAYGIVFGLTEGTEKALVADLVPAAHRGRAFGWYHGGLGLMALPASLLFGALWAAFGPSWAFGCGAALALAASTWLAVIARDLRGR